MTGLFKRTWTICSVPCAFCLKCSELIDSSTIWNIRLICNGSGTEIEKPGSHTPHLFGRFPPARSLGDLARSLGDLDEKRKAGKTKRSTGRSAFAVQWWKGFKSLASVQKSPRFWPFRWSFGLPRKAVQKRGPLFETHPLAHWWRSHRSRSLRACVSSLPSEVQAIRRPQNMQVPFCYDTASGENSNWCHEF